MSSWFFYFLTLFISGIFLKSYWEISWLFFLNAALIFSAGAILSFLDHKNSRIFWLLTLCSISIALGIIRLDLAFSYGDELKSLRDTEEVISLKGRIAGQIDLRDDHVNYVVLVKPQKEKILVTAPLFSNFRPGDQIILHGKLQTPAQFSDFNYREFLLKDGITTVSYYPEIELSQKNNSIFPTILLKIKNTLRKSNNKIYPFPQSELSAAMILGDKQLLPQNLKNSFSKTGLSHIAAISGMHITVISLILMASFLQFGLSKDRSFYFVLTLLFFYIALVGFPPSAIRAGFMAGAYLLSQKVRREYVAIRALVLVAFLMLLWNPMLLRLDLGFQLSFLAVLGIIYISPFFYASLNKLIKSKKWNGFKKILAITLGAQISTLPILVYNFGLFSISAPLANILVVPLLPFVLGFGFAGIITGIISRSLAVLVSFPAYLLLSYIIWISKTFEKLRFTVIEVKDARISSLVLIYVILIILILFLRKKFQRI